MFGVGEGGAVGGVGMTTSGRVVHPTRPECGSKMSKRWRTTKKKKCCYILKEGKRET